MKKFMIQNLIFIIGSCILAFGLYNIHTQSGITEGGLLGLSLLTYHWFSISPSFVIGVISILLFLLGLKEFGKKYFFTSAISTLIFSIVYRLFETQGYLLPNLSTKPITAAILGGLFVGIGCGLLVCAGGASGGDDILATIVSKKAKITLPKAYFIMDVLILLISLSYLPWYKVLCSLLTVTISSTIIGKMYQSRVFCFR